MINTVGELIEALQGFPATALVRADKKPIVAVIAPSTNGPVEIVTGPSPAPGATP